MTLQELQKQVLRLLPQERWQLVQVALASLREETLSEVKLKNLSRIRGIAKRTATLKDTEDYETYLTQKYQ